LAAPHPHEDDRQDHHKDSQHDAKREHVLGLFGAGGSGGVVGSTARSGSQFSKRFGFASGDDVQSAGDGNFGPHAVTVLLAQGLCRRRADGLAAGRLVRVPRALRVSITFGLRLVDRADVADAVASGVAPHALRVALAVVGRAVRAVVLVAARHGEWAPNAARGCLTGSHRVDSDAWLRLASGAVDTSPCALVVGQAVVLRDVSAEALNTATFFAHHAALVVVARSSGRVASAAAGAAGSSNHRAGGVRGASGDGQVDARVLDIDGADGLDGVEVAPTDLVARRDVGGGTARGDGAGASHNLAHWVSGACSNFVLAWLIEAAGRGERCSATDVAEGAVVHAEVAGREDAVWGDGRPSSSIGWHQHIAVVVGRDGLRVVGRPVGVLEGDSETSIAAEEGLSRQRGVDVPAPVRAIDAVGSLAAEPRAAGSADREPQTVLFQRAADRGQLAAEAKVAARLALLLRRQVSDLFSWDILTEALRAEVTEEDGADFARRVRNEGPSEVAWRAR